MGLTSRVPVQHCSLQPWSFLSHPDTATAGRFSTLAQPLHSSWNYFSALPSSILDTYRSQEFILRCHIFLPFHTVHGVLTARILKWFAIPFYSGPRFVRTVCHDLSILGGPTCVAQSFIELHKAVIHVMLLVSFLCLWFSFWRLWDYSSCFFCLPSDG